MPRQHLPHRAHRAAAATLLALAAAITLHASSPLEQSAYRLPLNGEWDFLYIPGAQPAPGAEAPPIQNPESKIQNPPVLAPAANFNTPDFAPAKPWSTIKVPGHWELQGFAPPLYKAPAEGTGYYHRTFRLDQLAPENSAPDGFDPHRQQLYLRFEGVLHGFDLWVNGKHAGAWGSAYNPATFDITDLVRPGADNHLAVRVTTRNKGWEFDTNDCWGLSGIYRDVYLYALPMRDTHIDAFTTRTTLLPDGSARLDLTLTTTTPDTTPLSHSPLPTPPSAFSPSALQPFILTARLHDPAGHPAGEFTLTPSRGTHTTTATITIPHPQLWTAETPHLYELRLTLTAPTPAAGAEAPPIQNPVPSEARSLTSKIQNPPAPVPLHDTRHKIGLRQITIDGPVLKLNATPIKLRGVDHHDLWPETGRACTDAQIRRDLELMRDANINFIRTSHYPPHPRLLDLADELGFYIMCEVPFGFGDRHLTDPSYQDILLTRARATVARDQNHPSIIVWSLGNENPITDIQLATAREVKRLDPTRPICIPTVGSYFQRNYEKFPDYVDIYAPHYPTPKTLATYARTLDRPIIVTEYAHALGLATERLHALWEIMRTNPNMAGGAIWMFQDQGILREGDINDPAHAAQPYIWPDANHYYDTGGTDGMDGIVYSDRTPQTDYYEVRKVYSPVVITHHELTPDPQTPRLTLHLENRHDFRDLTDHKLTWHIEANGERIKQGELALHAPAQKTEVLEIPLTDFLPLPDAITILSLQCHDAAGRQIYERGIKLAMPDAPRLIDTLAGQLPTPAITLENTDTTIRITHPNFIITTQRDTGITAITAPDGRPLVSGIFPHTGRRFTEADKTRVTRSKAEIWPEPYLTQSTFTRHSITQSPAVTQPTTIKPQAFKADDGAVVLIIDALYTGTHGAIHGGYTLQARPNGAIEISYGYTPTGKGLLLEAGLTLVMPPDATEYRWLGLGPLTSSPGKEHAAEYGRHHLTRGDLNFNGNRRGTDLAALTRPDGTGILMAPGAESPADIAIEAPLTPGGDITISHNAAISGRGNKGVPPEHELRIETLGRIQGTITLIPLTKPWPAPLPRWLGPANTRVSPHAPYLRSYDD